MLHSLDSDKVMHSAGSFVVGLLTSAEQSLLLLSGGSAVESYVPIADAIQSGSVSTVVLGQVDERYGPVGHANSNALLIEQKTGLERLCQEYGIEYKPMLSPDLSLEDTVSQYADWLSHSLPLCPRRIAVLGIGPDGHTAGILPTDAARFDQTFNIDSLVVGYEAQSGPFRQRITITPKMLQYCTDVVVVAMGEAKRKVLQQILAEDSQPIHQLPAGLLRSSQNVHIFTDLQI